METRFLESFIKVVELGSIAEAARHLNLAPASLAQRVQALENDLGVQVLKRAGKTVRPTIAGMRILDRARELVNLSRDLKAQASDTELPAGPLHVGATPTSLTGMLPSALHAWRQQFGTTGLHLYPGASPSLYQRVLSGELDAAVITDLQHEYPKSCLWTPLRTERLILIAHRTITRPRQVLSLINSQPFILFDRNIINGKMVDQYLRERRLKPKVIFELDGIDNIAHMVDENLGVAIVPDWTAPPNAFSSVVRYPLPEPVPMRRVGFLINRTSPRLPLAEILLKLLDGSGAGG